MKLQIEKNKFFKRSMILAEKWRIKNRRAAQRWEEIFSHFAVFLAKTCRKNHTSAKKILFFE